MFGNEIYRITGRKDQFGEVEDFICNECRFEKKTLTDWVIEGPRHIKRQSVISSNHYEERIEQSLIDPIAGKMFQQE
jgi:NADH-quinone oxidoreductase subunit G